MKRLWLVALAAAGVLAVTAVPAAPQTSAARCQATPQDGFGPFGRGLPPLRGKIGTGHVLTGVVLSALDCRPIPGAQVQFWQENKRGVYTTKFSGTVITDRTGRFRFEGPYPPSVDFEPHIHIRVFAKGFRPLLTRYVPAPGARRGSVKLVLEPEEL